MRTRFAFVFYLEDRKLANSPRTPRQGRSIKTHARILSAVSGLLRDKQFNEISINEIAGHAGVSVGGLYSRFRSKEELLRCFHDEMLTAQRARLVAEFSPTQWNGLGIESIIRRYVEVAIEIFAGNAPLLREIALRSRAGDSQIRQDAERLNDSVDGAVVELLLLRRDEIDAPDPALAVRIGLLAVSAALREMLLFGERPAGVDDSQLANEMVRLFTSYLQRARISRDPSA